MKIFGIGLNKTGTTTLASCLRTLGFNHTSCNRSLTRCAKRGEINPIIDHAARYDSFEDWPWPLVYKEMDRHFDDAKFILTRRKNADIWFSSLKRHALRTGPTEYRDIVYGHKMPHGEKREHVRIYRSHNKEVRQYFSEREEDVLEICWEEGDDWDALCSFLDVSIPDVPFPHEKRGRSKLLSTLSYLKGYVRHRVLGREWSTNL